MTLPPTMAQIQSSIPNVSDYQFSTPKMIQFFRSRCDTQHEKGMSSVSVLNGYILNYESCYCRVPDPVIHSSVQPQ